MREWVNFYPTSTDNEAMVRVATRPIETDLPRPRGTSLPPSSAPALETGLAPHVARVNHGVSTVGRSTNKSQKISLGGGLSIGASGRILIDGKLPSAIPGQGGDARALEMAARLCSDQGGLFDKVSMNSSVREKIFGQLSAALDNAGKNKGIQKERVVSGAIALLLDLARATPKSDDSLFDKITDRLLAALEKNQDPELGAFYIQLAQSQIAKRFDPAAKSRMTKLFKTLLPERPPVELWTENRTKPLEVRHSIHEEFWKDELKYFSKANGFTLLKKNAADTFRVYSGEIPDPTGKNPPLKVNMTVRKDELDVFEPISDPNVHVILYSGHSSLGGNGSQSIQDAGSMKGPHPKLILAANCRGKDNYAAFTKKYPNAHAIMTEHPTYGDSGQHRIDALFKTLARGETYSYMRSISEEPFWDEPANNYFYPDELRKFRFMDVDGDGQLDKSKIGSDRYFDPGQRAGADKFVRALNFTNSELFYHWEVEHEKGKKSYYGKEYGDALVPFGPIKGESKRLVEVEVEKVGSGRAFEVRYAPGPARNMDQNLYAGMATCQTVLALAKYKASDKVILREALRAVLMGAHAIHYLDVYADTNPKTQREYFEKVGLVKNFDSKKVDDIFKKYDANSSTEQVEALEKLLRETYKVDLEAWLPKFLEQNG